MKYILLLILLLSLLGATKIYAASNNSRYDFTSGKPAITNDTTSVCTSTSKNRYGFTSGKPATTFDATATCTSSVPANPQDIIIFGSSTYKNNVIFK